MLLNAQSPEKPAQDPQGILQVHSIFPTLQGEGPFTGQRAVFVRLAGCNLQCPLCDTDYTSVRTLMTPAQMLIEIEEKARAFDPGPPLLVVITGGEPFRQNLRPLIKYLLNCSYPYRIQIETNGTLFQKLPFEQITVVCSPKTGRIHPRLAPFIDDYKYVLHHDSVAEDGLPVRALGHPNSGTVARPPKWFGGQMFLNPADVKDESANEANRRACVESCMQHGYTFGLQVHKLINME